METLQETLYKISYAHHHHNVLIYFNVSLLTLGISDTVKSKQLLRELIVYYPFGYCTPT